MFESTILQFKEISTSEHGFGTFWNVSEPFFFVSEDDTEMPRCVPLCPCDLSRPLKHRRWIRSTLLSIHRDFLVDFW